MSVVPLPYIDNGFISSGKDLPKPQTVALKCASISNITTSPVILALSAHHHLHSFSACYQHSASVGRAASAAHSLRNGARLRNDASGL